MMNRVYRTVFNRSLGVWQAASELVKCRGTGGSGTALRNALISGVWLGSVVIGMPQAKAQTVIDGGATVTVPGTYPSPWNVNNGLVVGNSDGILDQDAQARVARRIGPGGLDGDFDLLTQFGERAGHVSPPFQFSRFAILKGSSHTMIIFVYFFFS